MILSLVVAASDNEVIGADGALPWHLPQDFRRFRALTTGHVVVLGRATHESIVARLGKPLPGRTSIVLTRSVPSSSDGVRWVGSLADAWAVAEEAAAAAGDDEVFVAGGVSVYEGALPVADRVYLTRVHAVVDGDRQLPGGWLGGFRLLRREPVDDSGATYPYEFLDYERAAP